MRLVVYFEQNPDHFQKSSQFKDLHAMVCRSFFMFAYSLLPTNYLGKKSKGTRQLVDLALGLT